MRARTVRILLCFAAPLALFAQSPVDPPDPIDPIAPVILPTDPQPLTHDRILGIIPNFQTVNDPTKPYVPLQAREKWLLFVRETVDPYTFASAAAGAGISQSHNDDPKYGVGFKAYMQRFGAAEADIATQNFFSDAVLASFFPRRSALFPQGSGQPGGAPHLLRDVARVDYPPGFGERRVQFFGCLGYGDGHRSFECLLPSGKHQRDRDGFPRGHQSDQFRAGQSVTGILARFQSETGPLQTSVKLQPYDA